jgi:hypothetical protein
VGGLGISMLALSLSACTAVGPRYSDATPRRPDKPAALAASAPPPASPSAPAPTPPPELSPPSSIRLAADQQIAGTKVVQPTAPAGASNGAPPESATEALHTLYRQASEHYASIDSYIARLRRREQVNGVNKPEELLLFKFRKQPWSIYFKWLGSVGSGREVVYVQGQYGNQMHTLLAAGDIPFMPAGKRMALSPDSTLVRSASRHSVHEAGIGYIIQQFGNHLTAAETRGDPRYGSLKYLGVASRPEYPSALAYVELSIIPRSEPLLPKGGRRFYGFDPANHFPVLVITQDDTGHEVEFYSYDRVQCPVHLDDDDFNPDKLWSVAP